MLAVVSLIVLVGCSTPEGQQTNLGGDPGAICASVPVEGELVVGDVISLVDAKSPVTIKSVDLVNAVGIEVLGGYVLPDPVMTMSLDEPTAGWEQRQKAEGVVVGDQPVNIVVEVQRIGDDARAEAMRVTYSAEDGATYYDDGSTSLQLVDAC